MIKAYKDNDKWGVMLKLEAARYGIDVELIRKHYDTSEDDIVFVHMSNKVDQRKSTKKFIRLLDKRGVKTIPTAQEGVLYDDKVEQSKLFSDYMPPTLCTKYYSKAYTFAETHGFPLVSKSRQGSNSNNVRLINNLAELQNEIDLIFFSVDGYPLHYDQYQKNYIYLQKFIPNNNYDKRVICLGRRFFYSLKRQNRDDIPFASGNKNIEPHEDIKAYEFCRQIAEKFDLSIAGFDLIYDHELNKYYMTEVTQAWPIQNYVNCPVHEYMNEVYTSIPHNGAYFFQYLAHVIINHYD